VKCIANGCTNEATNGAYCDSHRPASTTLKRGQFDGDLKNVEEPKKPKQ
jgi:hypothetical protein